MTTHPTIPSTTRQTHDIITATVESILALWPGTPAHRVAEITGYPLAAVQTAIEQLHAEERPRRKPVAARSRPP